METGAVRAMTDVVMMDVAMMALRGVDRVVPMVLMGADLAVVQMGADLMGAVLVIVDRKVVDLTAGGADRTVLLPVDREQDDRKVDLGVARAVPMVPVTVDLGADPMAVPAAAAVDPMVLPPAVAVRAPVLAGPADLEGLSSGWIRSTGSSIKSSGKLSLSSAIIAAVRAASPEGHR